jgi:hypothetical protein
MHDRATAATLSLSPSLLLPPCGMCAVPSGCSLAVALSTVRCSGPVLARCMDRAWHSCVWPCALLYVLLIGD